MAFDALPQPRAATPQPRAAAPRIPRLPPQPAPDLIPERRAQARGLLLLAFVVLVLSLHRAGWSHVFVHRWWWPF